MSESDKYKTVIGGIFIAMFICFTCIFNVIGMLNVIAKNTSYIECGMCGAHVHDWWKIRNAEDTEFVDVCEYCYLTVMED